MENERAMSVCLMDDQAVITLPWLQPMTTSFLWAESASGVIQAAESKPSGPCFTSDLRPWSARDRSGQCPGRHSDMDIREAKTHGRAAALSKPHAGWCGTRGVKIERRDPVVEKLLERRHHFVSCRAINHRFLALTLDVRPPADQAPIQLETLSPLASHDLCFLLILEAGLAPQFAQKKACGVLNKWPQFEHSGRWSESRRCQMA
jgi:hypothetical protein